jgi:hypothetical protein
VGAWLREQVTLDSQTAELLAVVNQTMQPANVSLRPADGTDPDRQRAGVLPPR